MSTHIDEWPVLERCSGGIGHMKDSREAVWFVKLWIAKVPLKQSEHRNWSVKHLALVQVFRVGRGHKRHAR